MIDETRDISGVEQLTIVLRWVEDNYNINEDMIGLHQADKVDAESLLKILTSVFASLNLDISSLRGQTYDGAAVLQGAHSGVGTRILQLNSKAMLTHCLNHNLNLVLQEAASKDPMISKVFGVVQSIGNIIRASPKRLAIFKEFQIQASYASGDSCPTNLQSLKPLCPTRWTCRTSSIASVILNYEPLLETLEQIASAGGTTEGAKAAPGLLANMESFETVLGLQICLKIFAPAEEIARGLQAKNIDARTVNRLRSGLLKYFSDMRCEECFGKLYREAEQQCKDLNLGTPTLPRKRRTQKKIGDYMRGTPSTDHGWTSPLEFYRHQFYAILDLVSGRTRERFDCKTLDHLTAIEDLLVNGANGEIPEVGVLLQKNLEGDVDVKRLVTQLACFTSFLKQWNPDIRTVTSVETVIECMKTMKLKNTFTEIHKLIKLYLVIPLSNASGERSLSGLRRVKSYLRSTITQEHLNHLMVLHVHKSLADTLRPESIAKAFVTVCDARKGFFGKF